ncbi:hypothetical protein HWC59_gp06 [Proteus phage Myduc]|uniref:DUF1146 domain-containing protein n=1 Tax=Proteus phage Myduc TaxID=2650874 RepID=A0A5J6TDP2_9CAUD|nr:hypothetical protein HWC59_gp06 [Proteus phage Myduc]QFG06629.1 hypothetical protein CPT_Myduc_006 [Proteus phage Myduc]
MSFPLFIILIFLWFAILLLGSGILLNLATQTLKPFFSAKNKIVVKEAIVRAVLFVVVICMFIVWCTSFIHIAEILVSWL